jgi:hypothetical protein
MVYWGVDSATPANKAVAGATFFDKVVQWAGGIAPDFWGRYIGGSFALSQNETDFIFEKSEGATRILVLYNGATATSIQGGHRAGVEDALEALNAARTLGIPPNVWIYADIEAGWRVHSGWFIGWWQTIASSEYGNPGGFYCNPLPWNAPNFSDPFMHAWMKMADASGTPLYTSPLYSSEPEPGCGYYLPASASGQPDFAPAKIPGYTGPTSIWQYAENCRPVGAGGIAIDLDLAADDDAYATMWGADYMSS